MRTIPVEVADFIEYIYASAVIKVEILEDKNPLYKALFDAVSKIRQKYGKGPKVDIEYVKKILENEELLRLVDKVDVENLAKKLHH